MPLIECVGCGRRFAEEAATASTAGPLCPPCAEIYKEKAAQEAAAEKERKAEEKAAEKERRREAKEKAARAKAAAPAPTPAPQPPPAAAPAPARSYSPFAWGFGIGCGVIVAGLVVVGLGFLLVGGSCAALLGSAAAGLSEAETRAAQDQIGQNLADEGLIPAARPTPGTPSGPKSLIEISNIGVREVKRSGTFVTYSWKATISNKGTQQLRVFVSIELLDKDGFKLDEDMTMPQTVPAGGSKQVGDTGMMTLDVWNQVNSYVVKTQ